MKKTLGNYRVILLGLGLFVWIALSCNPPQAKTSTPKNTTQPQVQVADTDSLVQLPVDEIGSLEIPALNVSAPILRHIGYAFQYAEKQEQAYWVAYELTKEETQKGYERSNDFREDPLVSTGSAQDADYKRSGYDRGHLAPAADMSWSQQAMQESFYYSNMSPQDPSFNRGIWKRLEEQVRSWAVENEKIYVVTGPVLNGKLSEIGPDGVDVPKYYYKVILDYTGEEVKAIGFIMPNEGSKKDIQSYAYAVDQVEKVTGIDFYPKLKDASENKLESELCLSCWTWGARYVTRSHSSRTQKGGNSTSSQCLGTTKAGNRCKRMTLDESGYCYQHQP